MSADTPISSQHEPVCGRYEDKDRSDGCCANCGHEEARHLASNQRCQHGYFRECPHCEIERLNAVTGPSGKGLGELETINDGLIEDNERLRAALERVSANHTGQPHIYSADCDACHRQQIAKDALSTEQPAVETSALPATKFTGQRHDPCTLCGFNAWSHSCPPTNNGPLGERRPSVEETSPDECDHPRSELLARKGDAFEMRKCLECTKIFRVRLSQNGK